jgi:hypothetical protein
VRRYHQLKQSLHPGCPQRLVVVFKHSLKRLGSAPLRVLAGDRLDTVEGEGELDIERLLGPERPVVVEGGDALRWRHEIRSALLRHAGNKVEDRGFRRAVVPGGEAIFGCHCCLLAQSLF